MKIFIPFFLLVFSTCLFGQVPPKPDAIFGPTSVCRGQTYSYYIDPLSNATSIIWEKTFNGAITPITEETVDVFFSSSAADTGTLYVYGINAFGSGEKAILHININEPPESAGSIEGKAFVCKGEKNVSYQIPAIPFATGYEWTVPDNYQIVSGQNTTNIFVDIDSSAISGTITVRGINEGCLGISSPLKEITVGAPFHVGLSITGSANVCRGSEISLTANPANPNPDGYSYIWKYNAVQIGNNKVLTINSLPVGVDTVFCWIFPINASCPDKAFAVDYKIVTVSEQTSAGVLTPDKETLCKNETGYFIRLSGNTGIPVEWKIGHDTSNWLITVPTNLQNFEIKADEIGDWSYRVVVKSGVCASKTATFSPITIVPGPNIGNLDSALVAKAGAAFHDFDSVMLICQGCAKYDVGVNYLYTWGYTDDLNNEHLLTQDSHQQFWVFKKDVSYTYYFLKLSNGECEIPVKYTLRLKDHDFPSAISLYPNPSSGIFTIQLNSDFIGMVSLRITDLVGKDQQHVEIEKKEAVIQVAFNIGNLKKGVYLVEASLPNGERLIKKVLIY